jgi:hypothetical protein
MNNNVIYKIICNVNNKFYIGRAVNFAKRIGIHKSRLRNNKHINKHLQNLWNKYGEQSFSFLIIEKCSKELLCEREQYYLNLFIDTEACINISRSSNNNTSSTNIETRNKISIANKGKKHTEKTKKFLSMINIGKHQSEESKEKIRVARSKQIMLPHTCETKQKISKANSGDKNSQAKITWEIVNQIRLEHLNGVSQKDLRTKYNISSAQISNIVNNKAWKENDHNN